ncbi:MAG: hypothetical protein PHH40_01390 [Candidatus Moranbacteria bacterium]|nr:hypothetical protein [Candidatus Moranbacteria bacterium]MDD3964967.1 hypothetical protein [Candidatus Moranbacteria bacterium]
MKCITLSGVDGSGKSTQLKLLREKLERENWNVAYFHAVEFSLANKIARFFKGQKTFEAGKEKAVTNTSWFSLIVRQKFLFLDILRFRFLMRRLKKENCDYLLSDRYFYDSLINVEYLLEVSFPRRRESLLATLFWIPVYTGMTWCVKYLLPHPDKAFYFDVAPERIMSRENPPEQGREYLRTKQNLFKEKISLWNMTVIDADRDQQTIFQEILNKI